MEPQEHSMETNEEMEEQLQDCIEDCLDCHNMCVATVQHCLIMGGDHARPEHIRLLLDCAEICSVSANFMLRGSEFLFGLCPECAEICERCAVDCEQFEDDAVMLDCAEMCHQCADSCQQMAEMTQ